MPKDTEPQIIIDAIRRVCRGEHYLSSRVAESLISRLDRGLRCAPHNRLSARELEVMKLLSRGASLIAIGETLNLSPKTVSTYRTRILEKLNLKNNVEVARYVFDRQLDR